jgi:hypothetical protein
MLGLTRSLTRMARPEGFGRTLPTFVVDGVAPFAACLLAA